MPKKRRTLQEYADLYQIPLGTIANFRRRDWPLDDPQELLRRIYESPGKKPDLAVLEKLACGDASERVQSDDVKVNFDAPHLEDELASLRQEVARSFADFQKEQSPIRRIPLHKVYHANLKALSALIPLATKAQVEAGTLVSQAAVEKVWERNVLEMRKSLEQLGRNLSKDPLFHRVDKVALEQLVAKHVASAIEFLRTGETQPEVEQPPPYVRSNGADPAWAGYHDLRAKFVEAQGGGDEFGNPKTPFTPTQLEQLKAVRKRTFQDGEAQWACPNITDSKEGIN
ncbi:MAG TPA: hypothetical protein VGG02_03180 [Chthoniobacterales bacterium]|jgi:hypothetical protein